MRENRTYGLTRGQGRRKSFPALLYREIKNILFSQPHLITSNKSGLYPKIIRDIKKHKFVSFQDNMIIDVIKAEYRGGYKLFLTFNNTESVLVDLKATIYSDNRKIFQPLRDTDYFKSFAIKLNTITWDNEADFAPEFLLELGKSQRVKN